MILPDDIAETPISLKDQFFDLKGLSAYSSLKVPTLRDYLRTGGLPHFKLKGKILVKMSEFDKWIEGFRANAGEDLSQIVDGVITDLKVKSVK